MNNTKMQYYEISKIIIFDFTDIYNMIYIYICLFIKIYKCITYNELYTY